MNYEAKMEEYLNRLSHEVLSLDQLYTLLEVTVLQATTNDNLPIMLLVLSQIKASFKKAGNLRAALHDMGLEMVQLMQDERFIEMLEAAASNVRR